MQPGRKRKASGPAAWLLTPLRARSHIVDKLGVRWAILADSLIAGGALGIVGALAFDGSGDAKLGIFVGLVVLGGIAGIVLGARRKPLSKRQNDTQP